MISKTLLPYELCPRFQKCNVNVCPLHPNYKKVESSPLDKEIKCSLAKSIRKRLGTSLAWKGLKERELSSMKREATLTPEQKQARLNTLLKNSPVSRLLKAGCKIIPPRANQIYNPQIKQQTSLKNDILENTKVSEHASGATEASTTSEVKE